MAHIIRGIYHGDHIELKDRLDLPLGAGVRLDVEPESGDPPDQSGDILKFFGVLDDPSFADAVEEIVNHRNCSPTKPPVDFDATS